MKTFNDLLGAGSRLEPRKIPERLLYAYTDQEIAKRRT